MQSNIEFKDFEPPKRVTTLIDRLTSKLEKNTRTFSPDSVSLRLMLEHNSARKLYAVSLTVEVPRKTLNAKEEQHDLQAGIRAVFAEMERQLKKYKSNLRQEHWKRPERREEVREMKEEAASSAAEALSRQ